MDLLSADVMGSDGSYDIANSMMHTDVSSSIFGSMIGSPGLDFPEARLEEDELFIQGPSASSVEAKTRRRKASQPQRLVYCDQNDVQYTVVIKRQDDAGDSEDGDDRVCAPQSTDLQELTQLVQVSSSSDHLSPAQTKTELIRTEKLAEPKIGKKSKEKEGRTIKSTKDSSKTVGKVQCPICQLWVFNKTALRNHVKRIHEKPERQFKCCTCDKSFLSKAELSSHSFIHSEEKKFICSTCNKKFASKNYLEKHAKTHTGVKPFKCEVCGKQLTDKTGFVAHVRAHSGERPYSCQFCGKRYTIKRHLTSHMRIHSNARPYTCEIPGCGKTFRSRSNLRMHKDFHAGVKRWSCSYCNRSFLSQGNMAKHIRRHVGDKKYSCETCGKAFIEKQELRNHQRVHSNRSHLTRSTSTGESVESCSSTPSPTCLIPLKVTRSGSFSSTPVFLHDSSDNSPCDVSFNDPFSLKTNPVQSTSTSAPEETSTDQMLMITVIHDTSGQQETHNDESGRETCQEILSHPSSENVDTSRPGADADVAIPSHVESLSFPSDGNFVTSSIISSCTSGVHPLSMGTSGPEPHHHLSIVMEQKLPSLGFLYQTMSDQVFNCTLCSNYYPEASMLRQHLIEYHRVESDKIH